MNKKNITALTLVALAGITLVGCGNADKNADGENSNTQIETQVTDAKSPEKIVENFAKAIYSGDYEKALTMIEMPDGSIKDAKALENYLLKTGIEPVEFKKINTEVVSSGDLKEIKVIVETKDGNTEETIFYANLNKNNKWTISPKDMVFEDWEITVPKGATVTLNNNKLNITPETKIENAGEKDEKTCDVYKIPSIIKGNYELKVEHPLAKTSQENNVYPGASKEVNLELNEEQLNKAKESVSNLLTEIAKNATEGKDFGALVGVVVSENSNDLPSIQETYKKLVEMLTTNYKLTNYYNYKDLTHSNIVVTKAIYSGDNTVYLEGSYESVYKKRYSSSENRLDSTPWDNRTDKLDFKVIFEVNKDGNYLQLSGQNIFSQIQ